MDSSAGLFCKTNARTRDTTAVQTGPCLAQQRVSREFLWQTVTYTAMRPAPAGASSTGSISIITEKNVIARQAREERLSRTTSGAPATTAQTDTVMMDGATTAARGASRVVA